jgi:predicted Fe-Mo cluster-binding NifX family protein
MEQTTILRYARKEMSRVLRPALLALLFGLANVPFADAATIIAVASDSNEATSLISRDAIHNAYYLIFADTGELLEVLDNPYRGGPKGAAVGVADFLACHKVSVVMAEDFSPAVVVALKARGISPWTFRGVAREVVQRSGHKVK